jgi:hypothetical protein
MVVLLPFAPFCQNCLHLPVTISWRKYQGFSIILAGGIMACSKIKDARRQPDEFVGVFTAD